ncbi:hypothetical protein L6164_035637 [Bauhinia variegata]|uniref:Uncharacterized protein n=1 Tax=Bauhinia variegata TaxID=167791 RepID=A0ACB9KEM3_BAUVA|nr:hypothetical protein L6164_035637 [Bauhinia variegata]
MEEGKRYSISASLFIFLLSTSVSETVSEPAEGVACKHFVLVHGSCHGAWSWYKVITPLKSWGHKVSALDLGGSGINPLQPMQMQSISEYFGPLSEFMGSLPKNERVVLVGHSLGGFAISHAMENFPHKIAVAVFLTALMSGPTLNVTILSQESLKRAGPLLDSRYTYDEGPNNRPTTFVFGPKYLASNVYQHSPLEDLNLATTLIRPLRLFGEEDMAKVLTLTHTKYGSVNRVFIISEKDRVIDKDVQRWMIKRNMPNRVVKISGSDHMVMMSKPLDLCLHLQHIATQYS